MGIIDFRGGLCVRFDETAQMIAEEIFAEGRRIKLEDCLAAPLPGGTTVLEDEPMSVNGNLGVGRNVALDYFDCANQFEVDSRGQWRGRFARLFLSSVG